jgi:hypothetical protein
MDDGNFINSYWLDTCPICGAPCTNACRCLRNDRYCDNGHVWERLDNGGAFMLTSGHGERLSFVPPSSVESVLDEHEGFTALIQGTKNNGDYTLWRPKAKLHYGYQGTLQNYGAGDYQGIPCVWACYKVKGYGYPVVLYFSKNNGRRIA